MWDTYKKNPNGLVYKLGRGKGVLRDTHTCWWKLFWRGAGGGGVRDGGFGEGWGDNMAPTVLRAGGHVNQDIRRRAGRLAPPS